ncbi:hypothetical protein PPERSA_11603 [Pseudocohnilembus persalinus]|uniref:Uncharacterized protein n=1 Tax=Pseudocohnilembus persalinus TaxID=266149 RepID=A0A0V0QA25_PSEPJ|nr:hypothetical protein PPERSA_11603 [Pseudocohnilembus persalinus]|eukprot:KRW99002.1 hypothetical protein PPERSA_11603 [Pseudocohnilembus persalinus]
MVSTAGGERIQKMSEKLAHLNLNIGNERYSKLLISETKLKGIEEQFEQIQAGMYGKVNYLKEQIQQVEKQLEHDEVFREKKMNSSIQQIEDFTQKYSDLIGNELKIFKLEEQLDFNIEEINKQIKVNQQVREQNDEKIVSNLGQQFSEIIIKAKNEELKQEESQQAIFQMIQDLVSRVKLEIEFEKKEREQQEQEIMKLIEQTCKHLQEAQKK